MTNVLALYEKLYSKFLAITTVYSAELYYADSSKLALDPIYKSVWETYELTWHQYKKLTDRLQPRLKIMVMEKYKIRYCYLNYSNMISLMSMDEDIKILENYDDDTEEQKKIIIHMINFDNSFLYRYSINLLKYILSKGYRRLFRDTDHLEIIYAECNANDEHCIILKKYHEENST